MPPGAVSLDDVDLDQVSVDHVLSAVKKGGEMNYVYCWIFFFSIFFPPCSL